MPIRAENLVKRYREPDGAVRTVLSVRELKLADGDQVCLVGGSGSGKTTLLNVLAGIVVPTEGRVLYDDVDIAALSEARRDAFRAAAIGYVFQTFNLLQGLTAFENVLIAESFAGRKGGEARKRAESLLARMGLDHRRNARPGSLSVGEQQRVAIARAVVNRPRIVLADEPTANLDEKNGAEVLDVLREVASEEGSILLLVTHDRDVEARFETVIPLSELQS